MQDKDKLLFLFLGNGKKSDLILSIFTHNAEKF